MPDGGRGRPVQCVYPPYGLRFVQDVYYDFKFPSIPIIIQCLIGYTIAFTIFIYIFWNGYAIF